MHVYTTYSIGMAVGGKNAKTAKENKEKERRIKSRKQN
jgi:hypothetical protein